MDADLVAQVVTALKAEGHYTEHVPAGDMERVAAVRSAGRAAGRQLGWKIQTLQTRPEQSSSGSIAVFVVVHESTPLQDELFRVRADKLLRSAINKL